MNTTLMTEPKVITQDVTTLSNNWLDASDDRITVSATANTTSTQDDRRFNVNTSSLSYGNSLAYTTGWYTSPTKLRLTLSEVMKLRAMAKKDKALKAILQKFTPHIDLVVDFE